MPDLRGRAALGYLDMDIARLRRMHAYRREWADALSADRVDRIMPLRTGLEVGLPMQFNSDFPCAPFDPLDGIRLAVTRHRDGSAVTHGEVVGVGDAWRAYTTTPADIAGDGRLGRIAVGARADLIVLDGDPFAAEPDLAAVAVHATMVDGRLVYAPAGSGG